MQVSDNKLPLVSARSPKSVFPTAYKYGLRIIHLELCRPRMILDTQRCTKICTGQIGFLFSIAGGVLHAPRRARQTASVRTLYFW